jgi:hypothetical protein
MWAFSFYAVFLALVLDIDDFSAKFLTVLK